MKQILLSFYIACCCCFNFNNVASSSNDECIRVFSIGDMGTVNYKNSGLKDIIYSFAGVNNESNCNIAVDLILLLGDNFYESGVASISDPLWTLIFLDAFNSSSNLVNVPIYVIAGNHDYYGNELEQLNYVDPINNRWKFPSLYYTQEIVKSELKLFFVMVDTWSLIGGDTPTRRLRRRVDDELVNNVQERRKLYSIVDLTQLAWIRNQLNSTAAREARWRIVIGHYPIYR